MIDPATCPICKDVGGFHDEAVHAKRPIADGKALPLLEEAVICRACGLPVAGPGLPDCRYPKHSKED